MTHYKCLKKSTYKEDPYALRTIFEGDIEMIRLYRNRQMDVLRQNKEISANEQKTYFEAKIFPSYAEDFPEQILLAITKDTHFIGYAGLVHIDWEAKRAEISFLLNPEIKEGSEEFKSAFLTTFTLLERVAFHELNLRKLTAEVYEIRPHMMGLLQKAHFFEEGKLFNHVMKNDRLLTSHLFAKFNKFHKNQAVLVTSISKKVPLLQKVREALLESDTFGTLVGIDSNENVVGKHFVDTFIHTHPFAEMDPHMFLKLCTEHNVSAIIPTRDQDLPFFAKAKELFQNEGISVMVSDKDGVQLAQDKVAFAAHLEKAGLPSIPTYTQLSKVPSERIVLKEQFGSGSRNIRCNIAKDEVASDIASFSHPIFQPYIEGQEYSVDLYRNENGEFLSCVARRRDLIIDGEAQVTSIISDERMEDLSKKVAALCNVYGHAVIQIIEDKEQKLYVVECNMRFGGASTAACSAGYNSFHFFLSGIEGKTPNKKTRASFSQIRSLRDTLIYD